MFSACLFLIFATDVCHTFIMHETAHRETAHICEVDHRQPELCARLHALQMAAYAQEAALLGVHEFPPLAVTLAQLAAQQVRYFCVMQAEEIFAALALEEINASQSWLIASLVVAPAQQRRGLARRLLAEVLQRFPQHHFQVSTASLNQPACQLYLRSGFRELARRKVRLKDGKSLQLVSFILSVQDRRSKIY